MMAWESIVIWKNGLGPLSCSQILIKMRDFYLIELIERDDELK